jgi:hypothetical protein
VNNTGIETENGKNGAEEDLKEEVVRNGAEENDGLWKGRGYALVFHSRGDPLAPEFPGRETRPWS